MAEGLLASSFVLVATLQVALLLFAMVAYAVSSVFYSFRRKNVQLVGLFTRSSGYLLWILAGAAAIGVPVPAYLFLVTLFLTTFLATGKRRYEVVGLGENAAAYKAVLGRYFIYFLDQIMIPCAALTLMTFMLYVFDPSTV